MYKRQLADYFGSWRFLVLLFLICFVALFSVYTASENIIDNLKENPTEFVFLRLFTVGGENVYSFLVFIGLLGPLIGILFGFDAINSERSRGTLSRLLSQPIYRDAVINGKFLAGLTVIAVMLASIMVLAGAVGYARLGVAPTGPEVWRLAVFYLLSVLYVGFWLALGVLFSVLFRQPIVSALVPISLWILLAIFMNMIAGAVADWRRPVDVDLDEEARQIAQVEHDRLQDDIARISPRKLYHEAAAFVLEPSLSTLERPLPSDVNLMFLYSTVSLRQSLTIVWAHIAALAGLTALCFAVSYIRFVREEIRST